MPGRSASASTIWANGRPISFRPGNGSAVVPSYVVWNAMTAYRISERLTLQLNAINLSTSSTTTRVYYTSAAENHAIPGPGRTVKLTAQVAF